MAYLRTLLLLPLLTILYACGGSNNSVSISSTDSVVDDYGRQVCVPSAPSRIVSTSPAITEIIFALGDEDKLVGRTDFCTYPPAVSQIESIGGISNLNVEKIVSLRPDLVISGSMIPEKSIQRLNDLGIPTVCIIEKQRFEGLYDNILRIGSLIGKEAVADSLVQSLRQQLDQLQASLDTSAVRPTVYYVVGFGSGGNFTAGGNSFINDIISMAGGQNIAQDLEGWNYGIETLMSNDPEYIIVRREDSASFCNSHPYRQLAAVKKGNVIGIESSTIDLQVPRNLQAIQYLYQKLHDSPTH